jgi:hypothetical protein
MGRTAPGLAAADAGGCAGLGALAFGASGSVAGASSGGGSWAKAAPALQTTSHNDDTVTARNIGH